MKNGIRLIIALACAILSLNGCIGYGQYDRMKLSAYDLTFPAEGGSMTVTSNGDGFLIVSIIEENHTPNNYIRIEDPYFPELYCCFAQGEWMTVEVTRRDEEMPMEMTVTVTKNDTGKERTGYISLMATAYGGGDIFITQLAE